MWVPRVRGSDRPAMRTAPTAVDKSAFESQLANVDTLRVRVTLDDFAPVRPNDQQFIMAPDAMHFAPDERAAPLEKVNHDARAWTRSGQIPDLRSDAQLYATNGRVRHVQRHGAGENRRVSGSPAKVSRTTFLATS